MLCTHIEGNLNDPSFELALRRRLGGVFTTDEVLLDWDECRRRVIRKASEAGRDVGIRLGDAALDQPLTDGDVLGCVEDVGEVPIVVVARPRRAEALLIECDRMEPLALAHACWEVGNMHAPLFRGDSDEHTVRLLAPAMPVLDRMLAGIPGVRVTKTVCPLPADRRFSTRAVQATVELASDFKIVQKKGATS